MSFLYPAFLAGAVAATIPIVLHLLTRDTAPRMPFSAVQFLKRMPVAESRRRLRELLLLALRVTALLLLALAFARPFFFNAAAVEAERVTMVAVDTSFSMGGPGQFARAQGLARDAIKGSGRTDRVGVIGFADSADVIAEPGDRGVALAAIDRLRSGFGATRYGAAIARAVEQVGGSTGRIILVTDLQKTAWDASPDADVPPNVTIEVADAGSVSANLAVTNVRLDAGHVLATVRNAGSQATTMSAHLSFDGRPAGDVTVTVNAGALTDVRFTPTPPQSGVASVAVDDEQGYPADNVRYLVLDPPARASVLAVTTLGNAATEAFYLERALMVNERAFSFTTIGIGGLAEMAADGLANRDAVLLLGTRGLDRRGRETLERFVTRGGALFVVAGPDLDAEAPSRIFATIALRARLRDAGTAVSFAPTDARHPIFRPFGPSSGNLGRVRFDRSVQIDTAPGATILARFSDGTPALVEYKVGSGRLLYFASDLNRQWNDFPLQPSFVPFVQSTMRYLTASVATPGEYLVADAPFGAPREPGVVSLPVDKNGRPSRRIAINVDPRESDPTRIGIEPLIAAMTRGGTDHAGGKRDQGPVAKAAGTPEQAIAGSDSERRQQLWRYGLALMLVSLVLESALARKM